MKPCVENREQIALLTLSNPVAEPAGELWSHLQTCEGCRRYYEEISRVTAELAAPDTDLDIRTSAAFHQRVVSALRGEEPVRVDGPIERLRLVFANLGRAWAMVAALAVLLATLAVFLPSHHTPLPRPVTANTVTEPNVKSDPPPTIGNYERVASRSLDKLDELLTRQGSRNLPPAPVYTASSLARVNLAD